MQLERKTLTRVAFKAAGTGTAIFSRYNVIDSDGDVTLPGAFTSGVQVPISAWGHGSWQPGQLPIGLAAIKDRGGWADAELEFFDTPTGQEHRETLRQLGSLGQWSYGYDVDDYEFGEFGGKQVRFLRKLSVHEVSPVLIGAGVNTRTTEVSSAADAAAKEFLRFQRRRYGDYLRAEVERARERV